MSEELKPCPFCGGTNILIELKKEDLSSCVCDNCYAEGTQCYESSKTAVIDGWNTRPIEDALITERDLLRQQLDVAINMLQYFTKGWSDNVMANAIYALGEIAKLGEKK